MKKILLTILFFSSINAYADSYPTTKDLNEQCKDGSVSCVAFINGFAKGISVGQIYKINTEKPITIEKARDIFMQAVNTYPEFNDIDSCVILTLMLAKNGALTKIK